MSKHRRRDLGQVHVAAAAQTKNRIGLETASLLDRGERDADRWFCFPAIEHFHRDARGTQRFDDARRDAKLNQRFIGDDKDAAQSAT